MKMIIDKVKLKNFKEGTARHERRTEKSKDSTGGKAGRI